MYCTVDDVKQLVNIASDDDDSLLDSLIAHAQKWFETKTRRVFAIPANTTRYFTASSERDGGHIDDSDPLNLILDHDLATTTDMVITNGDGTTVTVGQYTVIPKNSPPFHTIRLLPSSSVAWTYTTDPDDAITISAKWGWSVTPPEDVKYAVLRLATFLYRARDNSVDIDRVVMTPTGATLLPPGFPKDVAEIACGYWRRGF